MDVPASQRILLDSNLLIDHFLGRTTIDSESVVSLLNLIEERSYLSGLIIDNGLKLIEDFAKIQLGIMQASMILDSLKSKFDTIEVNSEILESIVDIPVPRLEDALLVSAAKLYKCSYVVTSRAEEFNQYIGHETSLTIETPEGLVRRLVEDIGYVIPSKPKKIKTPISIKSYKATIGNAGNNNQGSSREKAAVISFFQEGFGTCHSVGYGHGAFSSLCDAFAKSISGRLNINPLKITIEKIDIDLIGVRSPDALTKINLILKNGNEMIAATYESRDIINALFGAYVRGINKIYNNMLPTNSCHDEINNSQLPVEKSDPKSPVELPAEPRETAFSF